MSSVSELDGSVPRRPDSIEFGTDPDGSEWVEIGWRHTAEESDALFAAYVETCDAKGRRRLEEIARDLGVDVSQLTMTLISEHIMRELGAPPTGKATLVVESNDGEPKRHQLLAEKFKLPRRVAARLEQLEVIGRTYASKVEETRAEIEPYVEPEPFTPPRGAPLIEIPAEQRQQILQLRYANGRKRPMGVHKIARRVDVSWWLVQRVLDEYDAQ